MPLLSFLRGLRRLGRRARLKHDIDEELRFHLEMRAEENERAGMPAAAARAAAQRRFGSLQNIREDCQEIRGASFGDAVSRDVRFGLRILRRNPGFTTVATLTLALGIGANAALFSLVEAVALRPLPFPDSPQLVSIKGENQRPDRAPTGLSVPELADIRTRTDVFTEVAYVWPMHGVLTGVDSPRRLQALAVSARYFKLLGAEAALGRVFGPAEEESPRWAEGAVLSHGAWERCFGRDPDVIGRKIRLDYDPYRIIGVMPPGFRHPGRLREGEVDIWITSGFDEAWAKERTTRRLPSLLARLAPGVSPDAAQVRLQGLADELRRGFPDDYPAAAAWAPRVTPLLQDLVGEARTLLLTLLGAAGFVLLICCASLAGLLLARAAARRREFAVRSALGTSRAGLVRQVLVESLLLSWLGAGTGLLLASALRRVVVALAPGGLPRVEDAGLSATVLAVTFAVSLAVTVIIGITPALRLSRPDLQGELNEGSAGAGFQRRTRRARMALVAGQIAVSVALLAGAGLLLKSFWNVLRVEPGFDPEHVILGSVWLPPPSQPDAPAPYLTPENRTTFAREVLRRVRAVPGVRSAAIGAGQNIPLVGWNSVSFEVESAAASPTPVAAGQGTAVSPDFFRTLGIPLHRGRDFVEADAQGAPVAIVDETLARRFWPGADPVGRRFRVAATGAPQWMRGPAGLVAGASGPGPWNTVVGVVGRIKSASFEQADVPHFYLPLAQRSHYGMTVFVRTQGEPAPFGNALAREVQAADRDLPVFGVRTLDDVVSSALAPRRFTLILLGAFALIALLLAGLGVYGIMAEGVSQRRREIGIRLAVGAKPQEVAWMIARQALILTCCGLLAGLAGAVVLTRSLRSQLFEASPVDPWAYFGTAALLVVVAMLAAYAPSRRAARTDPVVALRGD